jgi:lysyl-tRNA synthetase, class II
MSHEHAQDYTQVEFYEAFKDYEAGMEMVEELYKYVVSQTFGTLKFNCGTFDIDISSRWGRYDFCELIKKEFGIDPLNTTIDAIRTVLDERKIQYVQKDLNLERGVDTLWKQIRKTIVGPGFLIGVPVYLEPLAKRSKDDSRIVERFQVILGGSEMGKGFSELNDPVDQANRFKHQQDLRDAGDEEAQMNDASFVEALEYGMPPALGFGVSERLFSFLEGVSIREAQIFPLLRRR